MDKKADVDFVLEWCSKFAIYWHFFNSMSHLILINSSDTTESTTSASYLDLLLSIGRDGQLHTSIYDKRDDFNFHVTNFPFLGMAFLSLNLYDTPGLAPRMNVLFWGPVNFPVSYSNRDTSWNAWNCHSGSFNVDMVILYNNMKFSTHEC